MVIRTLRYLALMAVGFGFLFYGMGLLQRFGQQGVALGSLGAGALLLLGGGWGTLHELRKARPLSDTGPDPRDEITLHLREKHQTTGAFEHVVIFDAHLLLQPKETVIDIILAPAMPDPAVPKSAYIQSAEDEKQALRYIRDGVEAVLSPLGFGAQVTVSNLDIHPIDFVAARFKVYTERDLRRALIVRESALKAR